MPESNSLRRSVGVAGATMTLVGFVVGISIFVLPGSLAATAGPAVIFSFALAAIMAVFSCFVGAQIGAAFPVSGASFVAVTSLLSPFWGFVVVWLIFGSASVAIALLAYGFADYFLLLLPVAERLPAALCLVVGLGALNLLGIKDTIVVQTVMVVLFISGLLVFAVAGLANMDVDLLRPFAPNGMVPVVVAAIPAYFAFAGFMLIIEIGGEIKEPSRTIPRTLALSFMIVLVIYVAVSLAIVGVMPWSDLSGVAAPVAAVARIVLPEWVALGITVAAVAAAATSVNAMLLGYSRDVLVLAKASILPAFLAKVSAKHGHPVSGVWFIVVLSATAVSVGGTITDYAILVVFGLLIAQMTIAIAAFVLRKQLQHSFEHTTFKLRSSTLAFFSLGLVLFSIAFLIIAAIDSPVSVAIVVAYLGAGIAYFYFRRARLATRGVNLEDTVLRSIRPDENTP